MLRTDSPPAPSRDARHSRRLLHRVHTPCYDYGLFNSYYRKRQTMNFTVDRDLLIDVLTGIQGVAER